MKKISSLLFVALLCNMAFAQKKPTPITPSKKQPPKASAAPASTPSLSDDPQQGGEDMKAWMAYMTPGPMHQMLATYVGDWKEDVTFWMAPGGPATTATAKCTNQMVMDNRYQESTHNGTMNGMPFEGRGYLGFDNAKNVFVSTWIDNMGTGIMNMEGKWDEKNRTIHFTGTGVDPKTGKNKAVREEFRLMDGAQMLEMFMTQDGKEFKCMEIKYTR